MSDVERVRELARGALAALEATRRRIDDLNVYPVPDGDTGTNLTLSVRAVVEALESCEAADRASLAHHVSRAALLGARGNSGVILSQMVRGAAERLGGADAIDAGALAAALREASEAAYRAVRRPVEGTMLTIVRELAEQAERRSRSATEVGELLLVLVDHGAEALARTPEQLDVLREAGVVDAGGAGVVELMRGIAHAVTGEPLPDLPDRERLSVAAVHQELSRYRYCTGFVVEGEGLDADDLERELERLGDSLLVVGDATALKVHVHTDEPGAALQAGTARGVLDKVEIANMHRQTVEREERLSRAAATAKACEAIAVVAGEGNRRLFEDLGAGRVIEGGQTMNPSTRQILDAIEQAAAAEVVVLPNNANVTLSAEQAARLASKPARVVRTDSIPAGLAAMVAYDPTHSGEENAAAMNEALGVLETGAVTVASRDAELNGVPVRKGAFLGLVGDDAVAAADSFEEVARAVAERLLAEPRDVLTLLVGAERPPLDGLRRFLEEQHPELELDVQEGGQPHYPLLLSAE